MKHAWLQFVAAAGLLTGSAAPLGAFTVRETGFVEPVPEPFVLQIPGNTPTEEFREAGRLLRASGFLAEPAAGFTARLVAPGGVVLDLGTDPEPEARVLASPLRTALPAQLIDALAVLVVVEGSDSNACEAVHGAVRGAVERFAQQGLDAAAGVTTEPLVVTVPVAGREAERVLLWAGGLDSLPATDTAVLVLYGRGRRLGPALTGSQLTEAAVLRRLQAAAGTWDTAVDRAWQRGPAVPLAWDAGVRAAAVSALAFDPEDALVRAEVGQLFERTAHAPAPVVPVPVAEVKRVPPPAPQPAAATSPAAAVLPSHGAGGGFLEPWILGSGIAGVLLFGLLYRWMSRPARR